MRNSIKEIALEAGGSFYPDVGGKTLEKFADLLIAKCIEAIEEAPMHHSYTNFDVDRAEATKAECIKQIIKVLM